MEVHRQVELFKMKVRVFVSLKKKSVTVTNTNITSDTIIKLVLLFKALPAPPDSPSIFLFLNI